MAGWQFHLWTDLEQQDPLKSKLKKQDRALPVEEQVFHRNIWVAECVKPSRASKKTKEKERTCEYGQHLWIGQKPNETASWVLGVVWALMMQWAYVKLKARAGGRQDLNEKSPLLRKTGHPLVLVAKEQVAKCYKRAPGEAWFTIASARCTHSERCKMYMQRQLLNLLQSQHVLARVCGARCAPAHGCLAAVCPSCPSPPELV